MGSQNQYSQEVRERAVQMFLEHEGKHASRWETIRSIASKIGCSSEALRNRVKQAEVDLGRRGGVSTKERARVKALEREVFELRRANEILCKAPAHFAQAELDGRPK